MHVLWQRHHVAPCVGLGLAAPSERWCGGCVRFCSLSDQVALEDEVEQQRQARRNAATGHAASPRIRRR